MGQTPRARVLVVDDHPVFADALAQALRVAGFEQVTSATTGAAALAAVADPDPVEVALVDVDLGGEDGLALIARLLERHRPPRCLVLTAHPRPDVVRRARSVGAYGVLAKGLRLDEVVAAITATLALEEGDQVAGAVSADDEAEETLTGREVEILQLLAAGQDARAVAKALGLSPHTVRDHLKAARRKLGVHSQLDAVVAAYRRGLLDLHVAP